MDSGPADDLVAALLTASRVLVGVSAKSLAGIEDTVTLAQFRCLVVLESRGRSTLAHLAHELGVVSSTALRQIDRLVEAGLVDRVENPHDRREVHLSLTQSGAHVVRTVTDRRRDALAAIVNNMTAIDHAELVAALTKFTQAAGEPSAAVSAVRLGW